jgi:hypothetical protein
VSYVFLALIPSYIRLRDGIIPHGADHDASQRRNGPAHSMFEQVRCNPDIRHGANATGERENDPGQT